MNQINKAKAAVGKASAELVQDGMVVGLGTGSTAVYFIDHLASRYHQGLKIQAVATSQRSYDQAKSLGIPLLDINALTHIDITIDGADEIDPKKRMIKGGGGALLREKIIAYMSQEMVVIVDENKVVPSLGAFPLPIEIVPFAFSATLHHINEMGYHGILRKTSERPYITDNGNFIYDVKLKYPCQDPEKVHADIRSIPGVVDTGFFFNLAGRVLVGNENGKVTIL